MADTIYDRIIQSIRSVESLYHRLILVVGRSGSGKTTILRDIAKQLGVEVLNVNLVLSDKLLPLTAIQRSIQLPSLLDQIINQNQSLILLDNIEILFDINLKQDPLRLLQGISRNRTILASWNGSSHSGKLLYAEIGYPEYRCYSSVDALLYNLEEK